MAVHMTISGRLKERKDEDCLFLPFTSSLQKKKNLLFFLNIFLIYMALPRKNLGNTEKQSEEYKNHQ